MTEPSGVDFMEESGEEPLSNSARDVADRLIAGLAHSFVLLQGLLTLGVLLNVVFVQALLVGIIGTLGSAVIWVVFRKKSPFVNFQALQAVFAQMVLILSRQAILGLDTLVIVLPLSEAVDSMLRNILFLIFYGIVFVPFGVFGLLAILQILRGQNYRYPLVSEMVTEGKGR